MKSIHEIIVVCPGCRWVGIVDECKPDVDGDGGLGCPLCNTVIGCNGGEAMTDQEKLAALIGEDGYAECERCIGMGWYTIDFGEKLVCHECGGTKHSNKPKPPEELVEIAEGRLFPVCFYQTISQTDEKHWLVQWRFEGQYIRGDASSKLEARMACAIEAMERLKEEKDAR